MQNKNFHLFFAERVIGNLEWKYEEIQKFNSEILTRKIHFASKPSTITTVTDLMMMNNNMSRHKKSSTNQRKLHFTRWISLCIVGDSFRNVSWSFAVNNSGQWRSLYWHLSDPWWKKVKIKRCDGWEINTFLQS